MAPPPPPRGKKFRLPFWAGWMALIAGAALFHQVIGPSLPVGTGSGTGYQCWRNVYNCRDFRTRFEAQAAYRGLRGPRARRPSP